MIDNALTALSRWVAGLPLLIFWPAWLAIWVLAVALLYMVGPTTVLGAFLTALGQGLILGMRLEPA